VLMGHVSRYIANCVDPPSRNQVEQGIKGNAKFIREGIDILVAEGFLDEFDGPRKARLLKSVKPYTGDDDGSF
jgi:hypothetical protein